MLVGDHAQSKDWLTFGMTVTQLTGTCVNKTDANKSDLCLQL